MTIFKLIAVLSVCALVGIAAEISPDPETIPEATSTSVFYFVAPRARTGARSVQTSATGLDTTHLHRTYNLSFETELTTYPRGLFLVVR